MHVMGERFVRVLSISVCTGGRQRSRCFSPPRVPWYGFDLPRVEEFFPLAACGSGYFGAYSPRGTMKAAAAAF